MSNVYVGRFGEVAPVSTLRPSLPAAPAYVTPSLRSYPLTVRVILKLLQCAMIVGYIVYK